MTVEELWGRAFERRGSITVTTMPDSRARTIRRLSTEDVLELVRSEDTRSVRGLLAQMEMRRRQDWTARASFVISILALVVSALHA